MTAIYSVAPRGVSWRAGGARRQEFPEHDDGEELLVVICATNGDDGTRINNYEVVRYRRKATGPGLVEKDNRPWDHDWIDVEWWLLLSETTLPGMWIGDELHAEDMTIENRFRMIAELANPTHYEPKESERVT